MSDNLYRKVVDANIAIHKTLAEHYETCEPHFRPENIAVVESRLKTAFDKTDAKKMLDLGCGTGFMINIAKKYLTHIDGVDVSDDMMNRVDKTGNAQIRLFNHDTGSFPVEESKYDVITGYSFLHHLYDIEPTLKIAYKGLKPGGILYCDLDPNFYYWEGIGNLNREKEYGAIVNREIEMVTYKDEDIQKTFGVSKDLFNHAEYNKNIGGGFKEEFITDVLIRNGFKEVVFFYYWFIGQANLINSDLYTKDEGMQKAALVKQALDNVMPLSRNLFKYIGFYATK